MEITTIFILAVLLLSCLFSIAFIGIYLVAYRP